MSKKNKTTKPLRPYTKPTIEQVQLVAEEAILAHCQGLGPNHSGHNGNGCPTSTCQYQGS